MLKLGPSIKALRYESGKTVKGHCYSLPQSHAHASKLITAAHVKENVQLT